MTTTTRDAFLGGRLTLEQPAAGFRAGLDSVMLAAAVLARPGEQVLELGSGVGAASLCLLTRVHGIHVTGIEMQADLAALASRNAAANSLDSRARFHAATVEQPPADLAPQSFHHVMANPPFFVEGPADPSPDPARRAAHSSDADLLSRWAATARRFLKPSGRYTVILPADRLPAQLAALDKGFGGITVIPLWPDAATPAKRIIVSAKLGSRAPFALHPGLVLHHDGKNTQAAELILRGGEALHW
jgi:tRNA1(Val) A37 N6-methylase TrmN6